MRSRNTFLPKKARKRLNGPPLGEPWIWQTRSMLESNVHRSLSINARRVIDRILIEHMAHAGLENGRLKVTTRDFKDYGARWGSIRAAVTEACQSGFVKMMVPGQRSSGVNHGHPPEFCLTWLPVADETNHGHPSNDWKTVEAKIFSSDTQNDSNLTLKVAPGPRDKPLTLKSIPGVRVGPPDTQSGTTYNILAVHQRKEGTA
jgi:hypothetical protein